MAVQANTPRDNEYRAFGKITAEMVRLKDAPKSEIVAVVRALDTNRQFWSVLAADCSLPQNNLPLQLRGQIISLAMWVARYTREVLREGAELEPLIDVNRTMMEGLSQRT